MTTRSAKPRDAQGRFLGSAVIDDLALRDDYERGDAPVQDVAARHGISVSHLHRRAVARGWRPRMPHRIDPNDLVMRMFGLLDQQMRQLEDNMENSGAAEAAVLGKLVQTLDKLVEIKNAEAGRNRASRRPNKELDALRLKIAERIAELNRP